MIKNIFLRASHLCTRGSLQMLSQRSVSKFNAISFALHSTETAACCLFSFEMSLSGLSEFLPALRNFFVRQMSILFKFSVFIQP